MPAFIDIARIAAALGADSRRFDIDLLAECDSTNSQLLARAEAGAPSGSVIVAERQTAGRGRRGRTWISAAGDSLTFSLYWRFASGTLPVGLSLAVGLAVARAVAKVVGVTEGNPLLGTGGTAPPTLKWPNDILIEGRKLGGILVELLPGSPHAAVIGIGINLRLPAAMPDEIRATAAALPAGIDPHELLAAMLGELRAVLETFANAGFAALREEWQARHAFQNMPVRLLSDFAAPREGICCGVDTDGALLFDDVGSIERILSGEISLRSAA
jgi:BirA family biotin operon repressor/biotin-[acetyl-CoA-carboxylase] ligase